MCININMWLETGERLENVLCETSEKTCLRSHLQIVRYIQYFLESKGPILNRNIARAEPQLLGLLDTACHFQHSYISGDKDCTLLSSNRVELVLTCLITCFIFCPYMEPLISITKAMFFGKCWRFFGAKKCTKYPLTIWRGYDMKRFIRSFTH